MTSDMHFDALTKAVGGHSEGQHSKLLLDFLSSVENDSKGWHFHIKENGKTLAEGDLTKEARAMVGAFASSLSQSPGGGAGCPEKEGCANIGQLGTKCFYLCKTLSFNG